MAANDGDIWNNLLSGSAGAVLGIFGTIIVALINRQPPMAALIDARIRTLIEGYEKHVGDLQTEIRKLETKVDALTKALEEARMERAARWLGYGGAGSNDETDSAGGVRPLPR
jgi:uncharacterized protein YlxW (UPF0749 family)